MKDDNCKSCIDKNTKENYVIDKEVREVLYLKVNGKPIGRFCQLPGCNKRLKGKIVTRKNWRTGKDQTFELPILKTQKFCCDSHKTKAYDIRKDRDKTPKTAVDCRIKLNIEHDKIGPYREIVLYLIKSFKVTQKIRPQNKELWDALDKVAYYRNAHHKEKIKPMNLLSLVNIKI